ncbi:MULTISPECIES: 3-hydroxyacyl-ACP dehydratase FabZ family protein [Bacillus cereus group]|uniref:3-hydroxyacyl-ACP dehydratase FabZ family protein n=1 Tax=Bacillus cereus group TaxID=86661 RepID=UPI0022E00D47|nr:MULTISPECIES: 3-hydroxyacyl-ACP dehydratase FabZ family protein [unclassified Bacillus cereus group]MDA2664397.1 beta-hydroxyacyl-ACP dehydratase [Bacillus cereus group sp. Bc032]MDA2675091.1 beta-hydroxyacyl-ACP dehydratase [Bacillus cereus group sp. Bc031]MDA2680509.1 beta-hydroxyacyl-ACP dehydratase [Bacillus cereus group sp. Bc029]MDA2686029.1 beta-hydroxyacyl-ACP dehydratase [Bacillus cereus group sp. Bc030]MDA2741511.1 beta-hydroxyacyl-ACP dehydratase [Bacillus cereus group sp. Bc011]
MHIKDTLPHRYPFLMIDKVTNVKQGESVTGYKLITNNEWFINDSQKHMPHMLIVEALAQLSAFVHTSDSNGLGFLSSLDGVTFHEKAYPGDKLNLHYELTRNRRGFLLGKSTATVNNQPIVTIEKLLIYQSE